MKCFLKIFILCTTIPILPLMGFPINKHKNVLIQDKTAIMKYLHKYGYLASMDEMTDSAFTQSIMDFQYFMGIQSANMGKMNSATLEKMNMPRCGRPDKGKLQMERPKRYAFLGNQTWTSKILSYRVNKYTTKLSAYHVDAELNRAVEMWAEYSRIILKPAKKKENADISIMFEYIDDEGGVIGFALDPPHGIIYLDEYETWTSNSRQGVDLFQLAVHEFGHSLGLDHSDNEDAVMFPIYYYRPYFTLHADDILGIKMRYNVHYPNPPPSRFKNNNVLCYNASFNAIFNANDATIYILKDDKYWEITTDFVITEGPRLIHEKWQEIPSHLDTAFTDFDGTTYFFKGANVWSYNRQTGKTARAKLIQDVFPGIPDDLNSVFVWSGDGKIYFFKGDQYWAFNPDKPANMRVSPRYPRPTSDWNGVPNQFEGAVAINHSMYFFKDELYYKYNDMNRKVENGSPKSLIVDLLACSC